ncbi:hypothetical protein F4780DRAFT_118363 [Xylariomycetidae sp. FL0641]|nr:hypothetical protein F4780DRAFT_118363 [Xylariomycetidae sp. FL0641]
MTVRSGLVLTLRKGSWREESLTRPTNDECRGPKAVPRWRRDPGAWRPAPARCTHFPILGSPSRGPRRFRTSAASWAVWGLHRTTEASKQTVKEAKGTKDHARLGRLGFSWSGRDHSSTYLLYLIAPVRCRISDRSIAMTVLHSACQCKISR